MHRPLLLETLFEVSCTGNLCNAEEISKTTMAQASSLKTPTADSPFISLKPSNNKQLFMQENVVLYFFFSWSYLCFKQFINWIAKFL